ncbi:MAG: TIGR00366 family protein, partial [Planctomycetota bacterium]
SASYARAAEDGARGCAGIILQFPLYAGIAAMLKTSGLVAMFARGAAELPSWALEPGMFFLSGVVNFFVPSGGGQWGIQGPIALEAAAAAGTDPGRMIMAVAYGDQLTNMLQPFWALPLLAITGVKAREIVGYTAVVMLAAAAWMLLGLAVM